MVAEVLAEPWERQSGETARQFQAFTLYRDAPPGERSITRVAQTLDVSRVLVGRWSAANGWVVRAGAWDSEQDRVKRAARVKELEDMGKRQAAAGALMQTKGLGKIRQYQPRVDAQGNAWVSTDDGLLHIDGRTLATDGRAWTCM